MAAQRAILVFASLSLTCAVHAEDASEALRELRLSAPSAAAAVPAPVAAFGTAEESLEKPALAVTLHPFPFRGKTPDETRRNVERFMFERVGVEPGKLQHYYDQGASGSARIRFKSGDGIIAGVRAALARQRALAEIRALPEVDSAFDLGFFWYRVMLKKPLYHEQIAAILGSRPELAEFKGNAESDDPVLFQIPLEAVPDADGLAARLRRDFPAQVKNAYIGRLVPVLRK